MATDENRVALVTGSGKGVGAGVVKVLCRNGVKCCINCNTNREMAEKTLAAVQAEGGEAFLFQADVTKPEELKSMVEATVGRYGRLDILVNNAAMQHNRFVDEYDADTLRRLWEINIGGYWRTTRACLPYLRQSPMARIVNISSIHGKRPTCFDAGYAMTKGAIRMFGRELALELIPDHIPVNTVDLGGCKIEFKTGHAPIRSCMPLEAYDPNGLVRPKPVYPEQVGELVWFLCSKAADSLDGDGIRQDAGAALS